MGLAQISYSYEYLGVNTGQFVRTELADECFLILTQVSTIERIAIFHLHVNTTIAFIIFLNQLKNISHK